MQMWFEESSMSIKSDSDVVDFEWILQKSPYSWYTNKLVSIWKQLPRTSCTIIQAKIIAL